jgi:hypothetical protein
MGTRSEIIVRRFAGAFVVVSLALGYWVHAGWFLFTAFVGLNLFQSSFTGLCPLQTMLVRFALFGCGTPRPGSGGAPGTLR